MEEEKRSQNDVRHEIDLLMKAEASEAFQYFKDLIHKDLTIGIEYLLKNQALSAQEQHDLLTKLAEKFYMLQYMPGKRVALQQELVDMANRTESAKEKAFEVKNAKSIRRWQDLVRMRQEVGGGQNQGS